MKSATKKIAIITGYARNPEFTKILLGALQQQTYQAFDCYIYASPGCDYFLDEEFTESFSFSCQHIRLKENKGFAGNNNETMLHAYRSDQYDGMALVNDDTVPDPDWLKELVNCLESNPDAGAIASKMVFYQPFVTLSGITEYVSSGDGRDVGIRFYSNTRISTSFYPKRFMLSGFYHPEEDEFNTFHWTKERFTIELPFEPVPSGDYELKLFAAPHPSATDQRLKLFIGQKEAATIELKKDQLYYPVKIPKLLVEENQHRIIQNAGTELKGRQSYEVGTGEIDKGQFDTEKETALFCGGACLLSTSALEKSGLFTGGYFSYYEDSELSVRFRRNGYKIIYCPSSLIYHYHTGTAKEWSPMFTYYAFRNKIIFFGKTYGFRAFLSTFFERWKETYWYLKQYAKSRFRNKDYYARIKLNLSILKDAVIGIIRFKPQSLSK